MERSGDRVMERLPSISSIIQSLRCAQHGTHGFFQQPAKDWLSGAEKLPGGSVAAWLLQVLRVETLELQAAVRTGEQAQVRFGSCGILDFLAKCFLADRAAREGITA
jgi:hypothetical protein